MNEEQILKVLSRRALVDEQNRFDGPEGGTIGALAGSTLGVAVGHPFEVARANKIAYADDIMRAQGAKPTLNQQIRDRAPGKRMAGGLIGAMVGGGLGAGTAELVKRESPAARLIAKIQTQGGRISPADAAQLQELLTDTYSNISDYRSA